MWFLKITETDSVRLLIYSMVNGIFEKIYLRVTFCYYCCLFFVVTRRKEVLPKKKKKKMKELQSTEPEPKKHKSQQEKGVALMLQFTSV